MIWRVMLILGLILLATSFTFANFRNNHIPDSSSLAFTEFNRSNESSSLIHMDLMKRHVRALLTIPPQSDLLINRFEWSPNGRWILVTIGGRDTTTSQIYIVNRSGTSQQLLYEANNLLADPKWSPDSSEIAFAEEVNKNGGQQLHIKRLSIQGELLSEYFLSSKGISYWELVWLDKDTVVMNHGWSDKFGYRINLLSDEVTDYPPPALHIWEVSPDGNWRFLTNFRNFMELWAWYETGHDVIWEIESDIMRSLDVGWSQDSRLIAVISVEKDNNDDFPPTDIYIIELDGSNLRRLTNDNRRKSISLNSNDKLQHTHLPFSPNKQWLWFTSTEWQHDHPLLNVIHIETGEEISALTGADIDIYWSDPAWSPVIDYSFNDRVFLRVSGILLLVSIGLCIWQKRQYVT